MLLHVISSNIRFDNPNDDKHNWQGRRGVLKTKLLDFCPHIIGTQEGKRPQLKDLEGLLGLKLIDYHREWIEERMYPCLFVDEERFDVVKSGDIWLSKTPHVPGSLSFDSSFPRLSTWALLKDLKLNKVFIIANMHLDHVKSETRIEQIKVFIEEIKKINDSIYPMIILGDFNEGPGKNVYNELIERLKLNDPWKQYGYEEQASHHKFDGNIKNGQRIDWIVHSKELSCQHIEIDSQHINGIYPSDHFIVKAKLI